MAFWRQDLGARSCPSSFTKPQPLAREKRWGTAFFCRLSTTFFSLRSERTFVFSRFAFPKSPNLRFDVP
jgi:hypothetical protein